MLINNIISLISYFCIFIWTGCELRCFYSFSLGLYKHTTVNLGIKIHENVRSCPIWKQEHVLFLPSDSITTWKMPQIYINSRITTLKLNISRCVILGPRGILGVKKDLGKEIYHEFLLSNIPLKCLVGKKSTPAIIYPI